MFKDISEIIEELGKDFYEFKGEMGKRIKTLDELGHVPADLDEKLTNITTNLSELEGVKQAMDAKAETVDELKTRCDELEEKLNTPTFTKPDGKRQISPELKEKQIEFIRTGSPQARAEVNEKLAPLAKSLNLTVAEEGAIFWTVTKDTNVIPLITESSPMRQISRVVNIGTSSYTVPRQNGAAVGGWVGEREAPTETTAPTFAQIEIEAHELYAEPRVTQKMLEDAEFDVEGYLNNEIAMALARLQETAFVTGNGVKKPRGFLTYDAVASNPGTTELEYVPTGADGDWDGTNPITVFNTMIGKFKQDYLAGSRFLMSRLRLAEIMNFLDGDGRPIWQPSLQAGVPSELRGYPVTLAEDLPAKASDSLSVAFGNFDRGYRIVERRGLRLVRDALTSKPYVKFYTTQRVGGDVVDHEAIKVFKFSAS